MYGDDTLILVLSGDKGLESLQTINVFGNSNKPDYPHYANQLELYVKKEVKTVEFDLEKIKAKGVKSYHPK